MRGSSHMSSLTLHMLHFLIICSIQVARAHSMSINRNRKPVNYTELCHHFGIDSILEVSNSYDLQLITIIHNHDRKPSITQVLHTATWDYFTSFLLDYFNDSPKVVREAILTDINGLVEEFWRTSSDGVAGASFFATRRLLEILQEYLEVCNTVSFPFLRLLIRNLQKPNSAQSDLDDKYKTLFDGYRKMFDRLLSKSKDLGDLLRFLPGVVVQKPMSMEGMADLYRIKPHLLERLESAIEPLRSSESDVYPAPYPSYILDGYLSGFLQDQHCSQLHYCDPMLQHISICRHF